MRRYLVVANKTLGGEHLLRILKDRAAAGPCTFHVVVPASPDPQGWTHEERRDHALAVQRLEEAKRRFTGLGAEVTGEVGDVRPLDAILDVLRRETFDEIIVSTLPPKASRWLRLDLVRRLERATSIPVTHVAASEVATTG